MRRLCLKLVLYALPIVAMAQTTENLKQSLPSEWGGWQNLTYGVTDITAYSTNFLPIEVETNGKTIHLLWQEIGKDAAVYQGDGEIDTCKLNHDNDNDVLTTYTVRTSSFF